jgi:hypothetical protein
VIACGKGWYVTARAFSLPQCSLEYWQHFSFPFIAAIHD